MSSSLIIGMLGGLLGFVLFMLLVFLPIYLIRKRIQNEKAVSGKIWITVAGESHAAEHAIIAPIVKSESVNVVRYPDKDDSPEYIYTSEHIIYDFYPPGRNIFNRFTRIQMPHIFAKEGSAYCHNFYEDEKNENIAGIQEGQKVEVTKGLLKLLNRAFLTAKSLHILRTEESLSQLAGHIKWDSKDWKKLDDLLRNGITKNLFYVCIGLIGLLSLVSLIIGIMILTKISPVLEAI